MDTLIIEGKIMIESTRIAASNEEPSARLKISLIAGTKTSIPIKPKTTEGIPANKSTTDSINCFTLKGANLARYTELKKPIGRPNKIAPKVP